MIRDFFGQLCVMVMQLLQLVLEFHIDVVVILSSSKVWGLCQEHGGWDQKERSPEETLAELREHITI